MDPEPLGEANDEQTEEEKEFDWEFCAFMEKSNDFVNDIEMRDTESRKRRRPMGTRTLLERELKVANKKFLEESNEEKEKDLEAELELFHTALKDKKAKFED